MMAGTSDRTSETEDDQRRVRSVSADRILDGDSRKDSLSPDQRRVRSVSADRILDGDSREDSLSSLHTLESLGSSKTWGGYRAGYRTGYRRRWRSSWIGSQSLSTADESQAGR